MQIGIWTTIGDDYMNGCKNQNRLAMIRIENPCSQFAVLQ